MINDRDLANPQQSRPDDHLNPDHDRVEQFNELSEISLEERMNVADRIGIPVDNAGEAAATGTAMTSDETTEEERTENRTDR
ncbi:hypothetical protein HRH25_11180 [Flavisolibacter sp. BT320]|nr:hypothetical protein [Flavisolibacter longurius]